MTSAPAGVGRTMRGALLQLALGAAAAFALGIGLGFLSRDLFVVGLLPLALGVGAGAAVGFVALLNGGPWRALAHALAIASIAVGWFAFQVLEDHHFRTIFRDQVAKSRAVGDSLPAGLLDGPDTVAFLGRDADKLLEEAAVAQVGQGGPIGRWLMRADRGVRLVGPMIGGRALPVGQGGAVAWAVAELALATLLASLVLRRARRAAVARARSAVTDHDTDNGDETDGHGPRAGGGERAVS